MDVLTVSKLYLNKVIFLKNKRVPEIAGISRMEQQEKCNS